MTDLHDKIADLLFLVAYVKRNEGAPLGDLAARLGRSPDELLAYLDELMLCGRPPFGPGDLVELYYDPRERRVYVELDQGLGRPLRLTHQEALAVTVALRSFASSGAAPWAEIAARVLEKIRARIAGDVARRVEGLEQRIVMEGEDGDVEGRFRALSRGLEERREVEIEYYTASRDEMTTRRLRPYLLVQHLGYWYAVGHDSKRDEVRIFKVERIRAARLTDERFEVPASFDAERYRRRRMFVGDPQRTARVRFSASVARTLREDWSAARLEIEPDGSVVARLDFADVQGLAAWLLGFGPTFEVLEPADLRAEVAARSAAAIATAG
jgi:proteasome accessory factor C